MDESDIFKTGVVFLSTEGSKRLKRTCNNCGAPLTVHQGFGTGICDLPRCHAAMVEQVAHDKRERNREAIEKQEQHLKETFAVEIESTIDAIGATDPESVIVTPLPAQPNALVTTTAERKEAFEAYLNTLLDQAYPEAEKLPDSNGDLEIVEPDDTDNSQWERDCREQAEKLRAGYEAEPHAVLKAACKSCEGFCCRTGGDTGHLSLIDVKRWRRRNPLLTKDDAREVYLSLLPSESTKSACIFQSAEGCALPRELRSDHCNSYMCKDVEKATGLLHESSTGEIVFLSHHGGNSVLISGWSPKAGFKASSNVRTEREEPNSSLSW